MKAGTVTVRRTMEPLSGNVAFTSYLGLLIGLASITMLFVTLLISYSILRIQADYWFVPGKGSVSMILAIMNTFILLISSVTWMVASRKAKSGKTETFRKWTLITLILGIIFLVLQVTLWQLLTTKGFTAQSSIVGSVFYVLTGMHGLHILGGLAALVWVFKIEKPDSFINYHRVKMVGVFWHYLDILWICLFTAIFII